MSSKRHSVVVDAGAIVVWATPIDQEHIIDTHDHPLHQLAWASDGVLIIGADEQTWVLPRSRALWIPADVPHDVRATSLTQMVSLYFDPLECPIDFATPTPMDTSGLLGKLMDHLALELTTDERRRAEAVVFDLLAPLPTATLQIPTPVDDRAAAVSQMLTSNPADQRTLQQFASAVGASGRTLARILERETGMGFALWRTHIRVAAALPRLASGESVSSVAQSVGYANPSAFVAAFRRTTGTTPGQYFP